jgi:hypothetical protein
MLDTGYWMLDAGFWMKKSGAEFRRQEFRIESVILRLDRSIQSV